MGQFKIYIDPIIKLPFEGKYVSPLSGSDSNNGSINSPFATVTKASGYRTMLNGKTTENITSLNYNSVIIGTDEFSELNGVVDSGTYNGALFYRLKINVINVVSGFSALWCRISYIVGGNANNNVYLKDSFISNLNIFSYGTSFLNEFKNCTVLYFKNYCNTNIKNVITNFIFVNSIDLYNYNSRANIYNVPIFKNCLFRASTVWKWNGAVIPINYGTYGNAAGDYLADVISAMYAYTNTIAAGTDRAYFSAMFPNANTSTIFSLDQNGQTCKVIEDRPSIAGSKKIFNRYVGDNPVDYSLFLHADNVALIMSDELSYVGCYKANADVLEFGNVISVNEDGSDDLITPPDMLIYDGNGKFHVSIADSIQTRNRVRSSVFHFKRGFTLDGFQSQMKSGLASRFSLGKFQPYNITNAPTLPQESIEVIPYDDAATPSAFPRFSAMFNDKVQMWYHTAGAKNNLPVLFNDLQSFFAITTDKSLAEYGTWAVTNADFETYLLSSKTGVALRNIPVYYGRIELNLNYHI